MYNFPHFSRQPSSASFAVSRALVGAPSTTSLTSLPCTAIHSEIAVYIENLPLRVKYGGPRANNANTGAKMRIRVRIMRAHTGLAQVMWQVWSVRYQGELLGLWDLRNRDLRRKSPPETKVSVGWLSPHRRVGGVNYRILFLYWPYMHMEGWYTADVTIP